MDTLFYCLLVITVVYGQIAFPAVENQNENKERVPLYAPEKCRDPNELLYPGNQKNDWICDCGPGFVYYPPKDRCLALYRQGPCERDMHLILTRDSVIPECVTNPCIDGFAKYNGKCYELGKPNGPCLPELEGGGIFDVNATTFEVGCLKGLDRISQLNKPVPSSMDKHNGNYRNILRIHSISSISIS